MAAGMTVARRSTRAKSLTSKIIFVTEATWAICVVYEQDCLNHKALAVLVGADHRGQIPAFLAWRWSAIIYELRVYQPVPGQMPKLLARFSFWTTLVGESSNELTYILQWESLADRETRWMVFQNDPAWHKVRDESERDGPIVASINNQILTPTPFSALK
jgi:hypothetical protein